MFEKIGRKLVKGAKAEILEPSDTDGGYIFDVLKIAVIGVFLLLGNGKAGSAKPTAVIVNNYICKEE